MRIENLKTDRTDNVRCPDSPKYRLVLIRLSLFEFLRLKGGAHILKSSTFCSLIFREQIDVKINELGFCRVRMLPANLI